MTKQSLHTISIYLIIFIFGVTSMGTFIGIQNSLKTKAQPTVENNEQERVIYYEEFVNMSDPHLEQLFQLAYIKMNDLIDNNNWEHNLTDNSEFEHRSIQVEGWNGENLYQGPCNIQNAMNKFYESPKHKEVLDHGYNYGNIIIAPDGNNECYMVFILNQLDQ